MIVVHLFNHVCVITQSHHTIQLIRKEIAVELALHGGSSAAATARASTSGVRSMGTNYKYSIGRSHLKFGQLTRTSSRVA